MASVKIIIYKELYIEIDDSEGINYLNTKLDVCEKIKIANKKCALSVLSQFYIPIKEMFEKNDDTSVDGKYLVVQNVGVYNLDNNKIANELANDIIDYIERLYKTREEAIQISNELLDYINSDEYHQYNGELELSSNDNLNNVSNDTLKCVLELLKRTNYSITTNEKQVILKNNLKSFCDKKVTNGDILKNIDNYVSNGQSSFTIDKDLTVNRMCLNCKLQRCIKHVMLYVIYLVKCNKLEEKLNDRIDNYNYNDYFTFEWKYNEIFKYLPDNIFDFCYTLVEKKLVDVIRYPIKSGVCRIYVEYGCTQLKNMNLDKTLISENVDNHNLPNETLRNYNELLLVCRNYHCALPGCIITIAGLIHYLVKSRREKEIQLQRDYYHNNQKQCDEKYKELLQNQLNNLKNDSQIYLENISKYQDKIKNLDKLVLMLSNLSQRNLFIVLEGEDKKTKKDIISNIYNALKKSKRIENEKLLDFSLYNLASENAYPLSNRNSKEKDLDGVLYMSYEELIYTRLKENYLYVINNISEFVFEYKKIAKATTIGEYATVKLHQFQHILTLLSDISSKYFIIIDCQEKELDELYQLEPRLQYVYQNNRYLVPEFSLEDAFDVYIERLNNELYDLIRINKEKYKQEFLEYVGLNKTFVPFDNRELATYLALYSNSNNAIVFPESIYKKETVDEALANIIGLDSVKEKVKQFEQYMLFKVKAEAKNLRLASSNLHMIFTGNPGTGKTTIARIMAKMLYDMGIISENKLIEVERKDLVAEYIGQTATKTSEVINKAMGGVLFVDEAYTLSSLSKNDYGVEAIATLIKAMEDHKDKLVVIFAGYKDEMQNFLNINPGITSRIGYTFDFEDYTLSELIQIFNIKIASMGFHLTEDCEVKLNEIFNYFSKRKAFGNGRFVDKLIQATILKHANNHQDDIEILRLTDIPSIKELNNSNDDNETTEELLNDIIGLNNLKEKIKEFETYIKFVNKARKKKINIPNQNMHMIFTGNPGTGKTTVARIMAKILYNAGIIHENKLVEVEKKDLVGKYVGETALKTNEIIEQAMGGILFIDEAYSLTANRGSSYGIEAIDTLIKAMEDYKGEFIVIFAGYKKEMSEFMEMNSGILSRIGYTFNFEDYTREELALMLDKKIAKSGLKLDDNCKEKIDILMNYFARVENIGNGRFVDKVFQEILLKHSKRDNNIIELLTEEDIPSVKEMTDSLFNGENMINPELISEQSLRKTAIHEIGHALVRYKLFDSPEIIKITINSEGNGALGYVQMKIKEGEYTQTKSTLLKNIMVLLGGMVSEEVFLGEFANGNSSDLDKASKIASSMITKYGMSDLGYGKVFKVEGEISLVVQKEINKILKECFDKTKDIIINNKEQMLKVIDYLYENKEIDEETFIRVFNE